MNVPLMSRLNLKNDIMIEEQINNADKEDFSPSSSQYQAKMNRAKMTNFQRASLKNQSKK